MPPIRNVKGTPRHDPRPTRPTHAIVVFGTKVNPDGTPSPRLERRLIQALAEFRKDPSALVVVSGAAVATPCNEAVAMKAWLVDRGVPADRVVLEDRARLTIENAEFVAPLVGEAKCR